MIVVELPSPQSSLMWEARTEVGCVPHFFSSILEVLCFPAPGPKQKGVIQSVLDILGFGIMPGTVLPSDFAEILVPSDTLPAPSPFLVLTLQLLLLAPIVLRIIFLNLYLKSLFVLCS